MSDLTEAEANKLFNQASKALRESDGIKLSELMDAEVSEEETPTVETPADEPETPDDKDGVTNDTPPDGKAEKTDDDDDKAKPEPTELDKLREQLEKVSKENHSLRSQAGRVPHVQRKIQELDKKLEELEKLRTSPSSQPSTKIEPKVQEMLKGIGATDPDLADAIAKAIMEATNGVAAGLLDQDKASIVAQRQAVSEEYQQEEANRLLEMYPNAPEVFKSSHWADWKKEQPPGIIRLAGSDNADDVSYAFQKYAADMAIKYPELAKPAEDKGKSPVLSDAATVQAQQVEAERLRRMKTTANVGSTPAAGKVGLPDDPDALFKKFSEEIRKERTG